jgi:hypothetical protein
LTDIDFAPLLHHPVSLVGLVYSLRLVGTLARKATRATHETGRTGPTPASARSQ